MKIQEIQRPRRGKGSRETFHSLIHSPKVLQHPELDQTTREPQAREPVTRATFRCFLRPFQGDREKWSSWKTNTPIQGAGAVCRGIIGYNASSSFYL